MTLLYTGSSGTHMPPDVQRDLDDLRALSLGTSTSRDSSPQPAAPAETDSEDAP